MTDDTLVNAAAQAAKASASTESTENTEAPTLNEVSSDDQLFINFEMLVHAISQAIKTMSLRQVSRILRASLVAPFKDPPRFVDPLEERTFNMIVKSFDLKMAIIGKMLSDSEEQERILAAARKEAEEKVKAEEGLSDQELNIVKEAAEEAAGGSKNG